MILKIIGLGVIGYLDDYFNLFDAIIVISALLEYILQSESTGATALRGFRILRVLKMLKSWDKLKQLISTLVNSMNESFNLFMLICTFLFVNGLIGK